MSVFIEDMNRPICNVIFIQSDYRQLNVTFKIIVRQRNDMTVIVRQQNNVTIIVRLSSALHTIIASRRRLSYTMRLTRDNRCRIKICEIVNIFDRGKNYLRARTCSKARSMFASNARAFKYHTGL